MIQCLARLDLPIVPESIEDTSDVARPLCIQVQVTQKPRKPRTEVDEQTDETTGLGEGDGSAQYLAARRLSPGSSALMVI